jgi:hypothetical protein
MLIVYAKPDKNKSKTKAAKAVFLAALFFCCEVHSPQSRKISNI